MPAWNVSPGSGESIATVDIFERRGMEEALQLARQFAQVMSRHADIQPVLDDFLGIVRGLTGCAAAGVCILDETGKVRCQAEYGFTDLLRNPQSGERDSPGESSPEGDAGDESDPARPYLTTGGSLYTNHASALSARGRKWEAVKTYPLFDDSGCESIALIPVHSGRRNLGFIHLADPDRGRIFPKIVQILEVGAMQLGMGIERLTAEDSLRRASHELDRLVRERTYELAVANEALEVERTRLLSLLDHVPGFVCLLAPDFSVHYTNRQFQELFGIPDGRPCYEMIQCRDKPCHACRMLRSFGEPDPESREWTSPAGRIYQIHDYPLDDLDGSPRVLEVGIDITERLKFRQALQLERDKLKSILDRMEEGVSIVSQENEILYVNPSLEKDFGPVNGRNCYDYFNSVKEPCSWCDNKAILAGSTVRREWYSPKTRKIYDLFGTPIQNADGTTSKLEIFHDITQRKHTEDDLRRSEDRYRMLVETMNEGLGVTDENLRVTYVNEKMCEMLGYQKGELIGRRADEFLEARQLEMVAKRWDSRQFLPNELIWIRKDGAMIPTIVSPKAISGPDGEFKGCFAIVTDITDRRRAEEALRESETQLRTLSGQLLRAQEEERGRISRELHDELGQALSILKMRMGFIRKQLAADQDTTRHECDDTVHYLNQVIEDTRRLSHDLSPTLLEDLGLVTALKRLVIQFTKHGHCEVLSRIEDIDHLLSRDAEINLYRTIQEALTNIERHAEARNVSVIVERQDLRIFCQVEDDGRGFDQTHRPADSGDQGMGLAIMRERVRMMGASLELESQGGKGTRISFSFPIEGTGGGNGGL